ncbi:hypothetical protein Y1Q_0012153 [Alligator mississippiensis]|uniref:Uncharacterized protein n=1 Tax=Alligator mississippiensis TaxID=8496 RepID=A0A151N5P3_ALLMI|nr:hypothetical protein Y1Q_0012153 [Alligator mississippiensis]
MNNHVTYHALDHTPYNTQALQCTQGRGHSWQLGCASSAGGGPKTKAGDGCRGLASKAQTRWAEDVIHQNRWWAEDIACENTWH